LAETKTSPTLNSYFTLTVQVLDSNDNAPEFQSDPYDIMVSEALAPGTDVVQVQALDPDFGANGEIRYHLEQPHSLFEIDTNSGWIKVFNELDAEKEVSHELKVKAEDGNGLSALATVRIHVQDVNDNPHQFTQLHYNAAVNEGALPGTIIFQLMTEDADKVAKTRVDYYIRDGDSKAQFGIKSNGEVYVSRPLDRELKSIYKLKVVASDGAFVNEAKVIIEILDDNDNAPVCVQDKYWMKISEDTSPGFFLGQIQVTDKDENAKQVFILSGDNADYFSLDSESGDLKTSAHMDREEISIFNLVAHAQDSGMPEWECTSQVIIEINDINDNAPVFDQKVFTASMREDTPIGAIASKIHATDLDALPINKKLTYEILDSDVFTIDPDSGIVRLAQELDREIQALYNLTIRATDQGRPRRLSQTSNLVILVLDVNDNPPEFASRLYFASVKEDVLKETDVVRVLATSKDSGINADITYSIVAGNEARKFDIHPKNGMIQVAAEGNGHLDHETAKNYFLTIQAQDGGDPPLSNRATVNITVLDVNDNRPMFSQVSYNAMINEAATENEQVVSVRAFDDDSGDNGRITYRIKSGDRKGQFQIDEQRGIVSVAPAANSGDKPNTRLDREMISSYVLEIEASDHGVPVKSSTVLVNVDITDANDNPPLFTEDNYTVYVQEDKDFGYYGQYHGSCEWTKTSHTALGKSSILCCDNRAGVDR
jgi:protocadherin Fat 1/2/3